MEKTVPTVWYVKKCALGALVCCLSELALLAVAAALMLNGMIGEERVCAAGLIAAALAAFSGCMVGGGRTSRRTVMVLACAASGWLLVQVIGFAIGGALVPERSLAAAGAMLAGAGAALTAGGQKKRKKRNGAKTRRARR